MNLSKKLVQRQRFVGISGFQVEVCASPKVWLVSAVVHVRTG